MVEYDAKIIRSFADDLYNQAVWTIMVHAFTGAAIGYALGSVAFSDMKIIAAFAAGFLGFLIGQSKASAFKLQAQTALCQVKIEENTRTHSLTPQVVSGQTDAVSIIEHSEIGKPPLDEENKRIANKDTSAGPATRPCPYCDQEINKAAVRCQHCWKSVSSVA